MTASPGTISRASSPRGMLRRFARNTENDSRAKDGQRIGRRRHCSSVFYDKRPRSRELIYNFLRLRALRVIVDVKMALGQMTVDEAVDALMAVPMDRRIASEEADDFFAAPTGGTVYLIGKAQIKRLLAERRLQLGADFNLRQFHDDLVSAAWVPIELTRWEMTERGENVRRMLHDDSAMPRQ